MKKIRIVKVLLLTLLGFGVTPAFAIKLDKPPMLSSQGKNQVLKQQNEAVNPLYPAKYTKSYIEKIKKDYSVVGKDEIFYVALDMLKGTNGEFSRNAIIGNNLTASPIKIEFKNLGQIKSTYANYDALGWKKGKKLYIYIGLKICGYI